MTRAQRAILITAVIAIAAAGLAYRYYERLFDEPCPLRSCRLQAIMSSLVFAQAEIEARAAKGDRLNAIGTAVRAPQSKYLTFSQVTSGGAIVVEDSSVGFIAVFDPILAEGKIVWQCSAQPQVVMDSSNPSNISDCGEKYRKLLPAVK